MGTLDFLTWPYECLLALDKARKKPIQLPRPVVSVGNIALGGRAKTPMVMALVQEMKRRQLNPVVLTRGYGRKRSEPVWLDPSALVTTLGANDVGDEAFEIFLKTNCYVLVGSDRLTNARSFINRYPKIPHVVFILDDGFQHWRLLRDIDVVLYNEYDLSDKLLPLGRLREKPEALKRADIQLKISEDVKKVSSMKASPNPTEKTVLLTTHVWQEDYLQYVRTKVPGLQHVVLKDHAPFFDMLDVIVKIQPEQLIVSYKEAVKLCNWNELKAISSEGVVEKRLGDIQLQIFVVDCSLKFKNESDLWLHIFEKLH